VFDAVWRHGNNTYQPYTNAAGKDGEKQNSNQSRRKDELRLPPAWFIDMWM
jgi:hypothetical protein